METQRMLKGPGPLLGPNGSLADLGWAPKVAFEDALRGIFESYRGDVAAARALMN